MAKMGRPPEAMAKINKEELEELMKFYPTNKEASDWFDVSISTLDRFVKEHYGLTIDELREKSFTRTRIAIKRAQIKKALSGCNVMLIWVGKQYLKQSDKQETQSQIQVTTKTDAETRLNELEALFAEQHERIPQPE